MYLGRIVAIGRTADGRNAAMYRVSSRSFPNREAVMKGGFMAVMPRAGFEGDLQKNPYITYNCLRLAGEFAVVSNGSQTDPVAEKIAMGVPVRDAMATVLTAMDYEKDALDTPRIVAACHRTEAYGYLGIVRKDAVLVRRFELAPGKIYHISTYEHNFPCDGFGGDGFDAADAAAAVQYVINGGDFATFENPVTAAAALADGDTFAIASANA
ncbi:MAG: IMP cyclohydrolase [Lentisphaeria bacterium]|nr:IMP cyclohydrolase [Lentisphaeria bacterium]